MRGIFGCATPQGIDLKALGLLATDAQQRGRDSSGLIVHGNAEYRAFRAGFNIARLVKKACTTSVDTFIGHSQLNVGDVTDSQPAIRDGVAVVQSGLIVNYDALWSRFGHRMPKSNVSDIIPLLIASQLATGLELQSAAHNVLNMIKGVVSCVAVIPTLGKLVLFSNIGGLYVGSKSGGFVFSSERYSLERIGAAAVRQIREPEVFDIPVEEKQIAFKEWRKPPTANGARLNYLSAEEKLLEYPQPQLRRCTKCILPETMPFIRFDETGICNYCTNYRLRNKPRPKEELLNLVAPYRRPNSDEVLVPFSGGRDSSYALHLVVEELGLKPITYTYDWGMVTDLGQRNISRMSAQLGVENIVVGANAAKKRDNIRRNLAAWLKSPDLGMLSILTAGDKHFFQHIETVKQQTGLSLNLWGINPLEVTHFKAGFLGMPPDFAEERVYSNGAMKQLRYQKLRFKAMTKSPGYFNRSMWDTLSGEYYRSFRKKTDYYHVFDYWRWDEKAIDDTLLQEYDWETDPETPTTWRIGDGSSGFYNYVYYTVAGFTEHDTFRSNQIREGDLSREEALKLVAEENKPRYRNLKWYFDALNVDFTDVIKVVNSVPRIYNS